jgi:hypothetical protein
MHTTGMHGERGVHKNATNSYKDLEMVQRRIAIAGEDLAQGFINRSGDGRGLLPGILHRESEAGGRGRIGDVLGRSVTRSLIQWALKKVTSGENAIKRWETKISMS